MTLLINIIILGLFAYGLAKTLTGENLPLHVIPRFKRWLLKYNNVIIPPVDAHPTADPKKFQSEIVSKFKALNKIQSLIADWDRFNYSFSGTIYNVFDCQYCMGVWSALFGALFLAHSPTQYIILVFGGVGVQRVIIAIVDKLTASQGGLIDG